MTRGARRSRGVPSGTAKASRPIVWTERALADLETIGDRIAQDDPRAADRWVGKLIATAERAAVLPLGGRRVPEMGRDDVREVFLRAYRVVYRIAPDQVEVLTVFEGHRTFPGQLRTARRTPR